MNTEPKITIAVDGYSSCGKSTLAKALAKKLNYIFIDSGAMYRGVALFALQNNLYNNNEIDEKALCQKLDEIDLKFELSADGDPLLYMNQSNVSEEIRSPEVSAIVSLVAKIKAVRTKLVALQRNIGQNGGIVMDGRDIGSVVFPKAELKLFITASIDVRVERRYQELQQRKMAISREEVKKNLLERDFIDSTRQESPLIQTDDAIVIDNSNLTKEEQLNKAFELACSVLKIRQ